MMPDKFLDAVETFKWPSRKRLYDILKANQMSGVVMLSGDVHMT
jgi:phosphodiesterase/alkaline phosphatase D-like protein